jgi:hypothetical protein
MAKATFSVSKTSTAVIRDLFVLVMAAGSAASLGTKAHDGWLVSMPTEFSGFPVRR